MEESDAIAALSALAHPGRLAVFRLLVKAGPDGLAAGKIAEATDTLPNTLSANLAVLSRAGLVGSRREGRCIIYSVRFETMEALMGFLADDCCGGDPSVCLPLIGGRP